MFDYEMFEKVILFIVFSACSVWLLLYVRRAMGLDGSSGCSSCSSGGGCGGGVAGGKGEEKQDESGVQVQPMVFHPPSKKTPEPDR
ncbi:MAG: hypothetical protein HQL53_11685 [Magnetococcales bacterium]|nr:hypothetical protein [Magnetococcales bacterium]